MKHLIGLIGATCNCRTPQNEESEHSNRELGKVCVFKTKTDFNTYTKETM